MDKSEAPLNATVMVDPVPKDDGSINTGFGYNPEGALEV